MKKKMYMIFKMEEDQTNPILLTLKTCNGQKLTTQLP